MDNRVADAMFHTGNTKRLWAGCNGMEEWIWEKIKHILLSKVFPAVVVNPLVFLTDLMRNDQIQSNSTLPNRNKPKPQTSSGEINCGLTS